MPARHLVIVLGDQLDRSSSAFDGFDPALDRIWMAEAAEESTHVWSSKPRIALFLAAMRHFAQALRDEGLPLDYQRLDDPQAAPTLAAALRSSIARHRPQALILTAPGDYRVLGALRAIAQETGLPLELRDDRHFFASVRDFAAHAKSRKQLRMEYWYREQRRKHRVLMQPDGKTPEGGQWNFDAANRAAFGRDGPKRVPVPFQVAPDRITAKVIERVERRFAVHPGRLENFRWPVTRTDALAALKDFIAHRLPHFGHWQDAMWTGEPWLFHSHISAALNLKLLGAREVVAAAETAYRNGHIPLASAEGFIRQILGWREYVRGIYWTQMPGYLERNALNATLPLPDFYWTGDTEMACVRETIRQTLDYGYAHHIQRLMVTGLYALLLGVNPKAVHAWYLSVYVDAVEWVELPNTLGMSQFADGGIMASKPYIASGRYIERMSNYCQSCRFNPGAAVGENACPFTSLYWDFVARHEELLANNPRLAMQVKNLGRKSKEERAAISAQANTLRQPCR